MFQGVFKWPKRGGEEKMHYQVTSSSSSFSVLQPACFPKESEPCYSLDAQRCLTCCSCRSTCNELAATVLNNCAVIGRFVEKRVFVSQT